jgi:hypothetical protein
MQHVFQSRSVPIYTKHLLQHITNSTGLLTVILLAFYAPCTSQAIPAPCQQAGETVKPKGRSNMGGFNYTAFFLLGVDSLIACIVRGPMFIRQRHPEHSEPARLGLGLGGPAGAGERRAGPDRPRDRNRPRGPDPGAAHPDTPHIRYRGRRRDRHGSCPALHRLVNRSCAWES